MTSLKSKGLNIVSKNKGVCEVCHAVTYENSWVNGIRTCGDPRCHSVSRFWSWMGGRWVINIHEKQAVIRGGEKGFEHLAKLFNDKIEAGECKKKHLYDLTRLSEEELLEFISHVILGYREQLKVVTGGIKITNYHALLGEAREKLDAAGFKETETHQMIIDYKWDSKPEPSNPEDDEIPI